MHYSGEVGHCCVVALGKYLYTCASVTKQYNSVPAKGRLRSSVARR